MRYFLVILSGFFLSTGALAQSDDHFIWTEKQVEQLQHMVDRLPDEGLGHCAIESFKAPNSASDPMRRSRLASVAAGQLMSAYMLGCSSSAQRAYWHIVDDDKFIEMQPLLMMALVTNQLEPFFEALRPHNPNYQMLRVAYGKESDPAKRRIIAHNMERWRWMPMIMGRKYLIVNAASFEVTLWEDGRKAGTWSVIVGKPKSPTPVFKASVSGVILNPWWEIPSSIVAEGIGSMVRNSPATARRKGYVVQNGRYRQRPGPNNALGQMKLVMPNPYSVYLHDTPNKTLFSKPVRTFSHGCIRVGDAIEFAKVLLENAASGERVDNILASRETTKINLSETIPVYITYFTAEGAADGSIRYSPDIYHRDPQAFAQREQRTDCAA